MYDDLVKRLRAKEEAHLPGGYRLCGEAADAIEEFCKMRWHSIKEWIPDYGKFVIVRYNSNDMAVARWISESGDDLIWEVMGGERCVGISFSTPTHWMPLPEFPKEDT